MPDDTPLQEFEERPHWDLILTLIPSEDARWFSTRIRMVRHNLRPDVSINNVASIDMLYEKIQGELNNALRQLLNDIDLRVVKPLRKK